MPVFLIKIGSNVLLQNNGIDHKVLKGLCESFLYLQKNNISPVLISSGAVALGIKKIGNHPKISINNQNYEQLMGSYGWPILHKQWHNDMESLGLSSSHILVNRNIFEQDQKQNNLKKLLKITIDLGIIPIINENDAIANSGESFNDNDELTSVVADILMPDKVIILTNVDGFCNMHPDDGGTTIPHIQEINQKIFDMISEKNSPLSKGGMDSKVKVAKNMMQKGIDTHIANGKNNKVIEKIHQKQQIGTIFSPGN